MHMARDDGDSGGQRREATHGCADYAHTKKAEGGRRSDPDVRQEEVESAQRPLGGGPSVPDCEDNRSKHTEPAPRAGSNKSSISIMVMNVCGLGAKADSIAHAVRTGSVRDDVMAMVETKLHMGEAVLDIPGYEWQDARRLVSPGIVSSQGVGAWIREDLGGAATRVMSMSKRTMWLRITAPGVTPTYVALVYGPINHRGQAQTRVAECWWEELSEQCGTYSRMGDVIVMGDLNARIGDAVGDTLKNENGERLLRLVAEHEMLVLNSEFAWGKMTWGDTRGVKSIIDYVLVSKHARHRVRAMEVSDDGVALGFDHSAVRLQWDMTSALQPRSPQACAAASKNKERKRKRGAGWRMPKCEEDWKEYQQAVAAAVERWKSLHGKPRDGEDRVRRCDRVWHSFADAVAGSAGATMVAAGGKKRHAVQDDDGAVKDALRRQAQLAREWRAHGLDAATREKRKQHMRAHQHVVSSLVRARKRAHDRDKFDSIERTHNAHGADFYKKVRAAAGKRPSTRLPSSMQRASGEMTRTAGEAEAVWTDHYQAVSSVREDDDSFDAQHYHDVQQAVREEEAVPVSDAADAKGGALNGVLTLAEVRAALAAAHAGRAAGPDGFTVDMMQRGGPRMLHALHLLLSVMWSAERVPDAWLLAYLVPVYKGSGTRADPDSYRPIALMAAVAKLYEAVLNERMTAHVESTQAIGDEQAGFSRGRSCLDHVYILSELIAARREQNKHTYLCYLDMSKAYDRTWRDGVWKRLLEVGVRGKMWRVVKDMYRTVSSRVVLDSGVTDAFDTEEGLRQGSVLSPLLFSIFLADVIDEWRRRGIGVRVGRRTVGGLLFADDVVLVAESARELQEAMNVMTDHARKWRYKFHNSKCAVVVACRSRAAARGC